MSEDISWAWPEQQKAYRDMHREANKQGFLQGPLGQITAIDDHFSTVEERFVLERERVDDPKLYDYSVLDIVRWSEVTMLFLRTDNENVQAYIKQQAVQPVDLPSLQPRQKTILDIQIEQALEAKYAIAG